MLINLLSFLFTGSASPEDQGPGSSISCSTSDRLGSSNNDTNNNKDRDNNNESTVNGQREDHQESAPATGKILSSVLTKDLNSGSGGDTNGSFNSEASSKHAQTNGGQNQSVIRSLKAERSTNATNTPTNPASASSPPPPPPPESQRSSPSRIPANNSSHYTHAHTINHSSSALQHHHMAPNSATNHQSQRSSPLSSTSSSNNASNPSHQHVTVLVNPSRGKGEHQQQQQQQQSQGPPNQPMIQQHHQTTIVGIRRNSPPATSSNTQGQGGGGPYQMGQQHANNFREAVMSNGSSFTSAMMQAMSPQNQAQLQLLHNSSSLRNNNNSNQAMSGNPNQSNGNNGAPNGNHSLLGGQLQIPLQLLQQQQQQQMRIKRERSPIHGLLQGSNSGGGGGSSMALSPGHQQQQQQQQQSHGKMQSPPQMGAMSMMNPNLQLRHPMRDAAILLRVKNEIPNLAQVQQRMVWNANARINGVKPELIGGPLPNMRPNGSSPSSPPQSASQTPPRATPTVIMGESCGVRTMVWGFEPSSGQMPPSPASSSSNQSSSGPSQNEEAAQLLLGLGQSASRPNDIRPRAVQRSPHPLNMERLWAGDYSQLPAGQQLHALNLSQPQWMGGGGGGGVQQCGNKVSSNGISVNLRHFNNSSLLSLSV